MEKGRPVWTLERNLGFCFVFPWFLCLHYSFIFELSLAILCLCFSSMLILPFFASSPHFCWGRLFIAFCDWNPSNRRSEPCGEDEQRPRGPRLQRRLRRLRRRPPPPPTLTKLVATAPPASSRPRRRPPPTGVLPPPAISAHRRSFPARPAALPRRLALRRPNRCRRPRPPLL